MGIITSNVLVIVTHRDGYFCGQGTVRVNSENFLFLISQSKIIKIINRLNAVSSP